MFILFNKQSHLLSQKLKAAIAQFIMKMDLARYTYSIV